jgi:hypothetical protein
MTQSLGADDESRERIVLAPFAGESLDYGGFRAVMDRGPDSRRRVRVWRLGAGDEPVGAPVREHSVDLAIGSHRYQQYASRDDDGTVVRLPVAYHREEGRWLHLNGAFVEPEGPTGDLSEWDRHLTTWNEGCVFCHNTEPVPGKQADSGRFETEVAEVGIGCEACHGRAGAHVERHADPFRRMLSNPDQADGSIAQPERIADGRASEVCGRCHGNRIAQDVASVLAHGDGFVPGTSLSGHSRPIFADSTLGGSTDRPFASRFWPDGSPRLSAHEWQGLLLSPCHLEGAAGGMQCHDCHTMHGDEPAMQLRDGVRDAACVRCHPTDALGGSRTPAGHGGHARVAPGVDCLDCHMPRTTYGLLEGMIAHRVTSPDPGVWVGRNDMPDACTQCHVDRSRSWASDAMTSLGLRGTPAARPNELEGWGSRVILDLYGGDGLQRNLAAHALGRPEAVGDLDLRLRALVDAMDDEYPSVRWFAWRSARALARGGGRAELMEALDAFDTLAAVEARVPGVERLRALVGPGPWAGDQTRRERLEAMRDAVTIWIGE